MGKKIKTTVVGSYPKPKYIMGDISGRDLLDTSGVIFSQIEKKMEKSLVKRSPLGKLPSDISYLKKLDPVLIKDLVE